MPGSVEFNHLLNIFIPLYTYYLVKMLYSQKNFTVFSRKEEQQAARHKVEIMTPIANTAQKVLFKVPHGITKCAYEAINQHSFSNIRTRSLC